MTITPEGPREDGFEDPFAEQEFAEMIGDDTPEADAVEQHHLVGGEDEDDYR